MMAIQIKKPRCQIFPGFTRNFFSRNSNFILGLFIFNWRITDVQYCVGFCHTSTWISHRYTYVPSFLVLPPTVSPFPPLKLVTELGFEFQSQTAHSRRLSTLHVVYVYFACGVRVLYMWCTCFPASLSIRPTLVFPRCIHKAIAALETKRSSMGWTYGYQGGRVS